MDGVGISIIERPRPLHNHDTPNPTHHTYTLKCEEPDYLRCDTHEDNAPMRRALESFGFRECGTITVDNGTERVAYDWIKEPPHDSTSRS